MKFYSIAFNHYDHGHQPALDYAAGFDFSECELESREKGVFVDYLDTVNDIEIYYDLAADFYYFAPVQETAIEA